MTARSPAAALSPDEERFVSRPAVDIAADVRKETERRIHLAQAGAMASFAEDLEREGEPRAAVMADIRAAFYSEWAADPTVVPPEIEDPPAPADDLAAAVEPSPYVEAWLASADRGSLVAECRRLSDVALHNLARAQTAEAALRALDGSR